MRVFLGSAVLLWLAAAAQAAWAERLSLGPAHPDFLLVTATLLSLHRSTDGAAVTGFFAGLLHAAILNASAAAYTVSRTISSAFASRLAEASVGTTNLTVIGTAALCTLIAGVVYLFLGLEKNILAWLTATIGAAIYNALLAAAFYWAYRFIARPSTAR